MQALSASAGFRYSLTELSPWMAATVGASNPEAGKFLRVPGTNPFFIYRHEWMANRFYELLGTADLDVYLMNTGRVGGPAEDDRSKATNIAKPPIRGTVSPCCLRPPGRSTSPTASPMGVISGIKSELQTTAAVAMRTESILSRVPSTSAGSNP